MTLQLILIQQWVVPILENSKNPLRETNILKIVERLLKLAVIFEAKDNFNKMNNIQLYSFLFRFQIMLFG